VEQLVAVRRLAFFVGGHVAPNVLLDLGNIGWMLQGKFELDVILDETADIGSRLGAFSVHASDCSTKRAEAVALHGYLSTHDPDAVIQMSEPTQHGWLCSVLARYHDTRFVYRYDTDAYYSHTPRRGLDAVKYFCLHNIAGRWPPRLATGAIALGPLGKQRLLDRGVEPETVGILPPSIDPARLEHPETPEPLPDIPAETVAVFVGRLTRMKGIEMLLGSLPEIRRRRADFHLLVVGPGERPPVPPGVRDAVTFTGYVPPELLGAYLDLGELLVVPSLREGLPRVLIEGLERGLTPVARPVGEIPTVTDNLFTDRAEFVDLVCSFESLSVASAERFHRGHLADRHRDYFDRLSQH
jgi:glycosyltransferase involved in cell wall biosynthesis